MRERDSEFILRWAKKIKAINLLGGRCLACGDDNIFSLTFHHIKDDKENNIGYLLSSMARWSTLEKEVKKCCLLCANCHKIKHSNNGRISREKSEILKTVGLDKCLKCGYTNNFLISLGLHHSGGEKLFSFREYFKNKSLIPLSVLMEEIDKCSVLCANCHQVEHTDTLKFEKFRDSIQNKIICYVEQRKINAKQILDLKRKGYGTCKIATELNIPKSTVSTIINRKK